MIPTMIVFGLVFGRWWKTALIVSAVAWPALLWPTDVVGPDELLGAAIIGVLNAGFGALVHQTVLQGSRWLRASTGEP